MTLDPLQRITAADALLHPYFEDVRDAAAAPAGQQTTQMRTPARSTGAGPAVKAPVEGAGAGTSAAAALQAGASVVGSAGSDRQTLKRKRGGQTEAATAAASTADLDVAGRTRAARRQKQAMTKPAVSPRPVVVETVGAAQ